MGGADDFRALLEPGAIRAVFQPIVRLSDLGTIGYPRRLTAGPQAPTQQPDEHPVHRSR